MNPYRSPLHRSFFRACLALALAAPWNAHDAAAQTISDADRKAARELFFQGIELQNAGKFGEALDRFQRAQSVVNAPTNLLHIAECQAAQGKLVEAAETYRAVGRFALPPNPPPAFVSAQSQAAAELAQLEPRIPELVIDVTPANVPTLQVTIDDQPIPSALVGVARPLNPGAHKVAAQAAGYSRDEKSIEVKERSKQKVALELKSTGAVTYAPAGGTAAGFVPTQGPASGATGSGTAEPPRPDKPAPYDSSSKAPEYRSRMSILVGPRLGIMVPTGQVPFNNATDSVKNYAAAGASFGVGAAFRFVRVLYAGATLQAEGYGDGQKQGQQKYSGGLFAVNFGWISNPDGLGVILNVGGGYRWYTLEEDASVLLQRLARTETGGAGAAQVGVGIHTRPGRLFHLTPKIEVDFGSLQPAVTAAQNAPKASYANVFVGIVGDFDINLDRGPAKAASLGLGPLR